MNDRSLSRGIANLTESDALIRNNIHMYTAHLFGIQQDKSLDANIPMHIETAIILELLKFLEGNTVTGFDMNDLKASVYKYMESNIPMDIISEIRPSLRQFLSSNINQTFLTSLALSISKELIGEPIFMNCEIGQFDTFRYVDEADVFGEFVSDVDEHTIEEWIRKDDEKYGLAVSVRII